MTVEQLKEHIIELCYWYYVKNHPLVSDYKFDKLFKKLELRERQEGGAAPDSPTQMIYGDRKETYPEYLRNQ